MPYSNIDPKDMILRDHLARDRTMLANERTLLSYIRTAIALLASGAMVIKIFPENRALFILAVMLLVCGGVIIAFGIWRFITVSIELKRLNDWNPEKKLKEIK